MSYLDSIQRLKEHRRIALLTDGFSTPFLAKTAIGLIRYRTSDVAAIIDREHAGSTAKELFGYSSSIPVIGELKEVDGIDAIYIGIAPPGGKMPIEWRPMLLDAIHAGIDVVSGLHEFLAEDDELVAASNRSGSKLIDVRRNRFRETAKGYEPSKSCYRIHAVGHDCSVGKMVTMLEVRDGLLKQGKDAGFVATGQTGIMIAGTGLPIDCIVADFVNGAAEQLIIEGDESDYLLIEGQGSISHPSFSAVTQGLLLGSAPHALIFCYEAGRTEVKGLPSIAIPPMQQQIDAFLVNARLRHPCELIGFSVNTRNLTPEEAAAEITRVETEFGLPACDVYREGAAKLVNATIQARESWMSSQD